jgi:serine/threonine protein kinase
VSHAPEATDATYWSKAGEGPPAWTPGHGPVVGQAFGDYEVLLELGRGGMGAVSQARELHTGRAIALKVILGKASQKARVRFLREGQLMATLRHPGILSVHSAGEVNGNPFLACALVDLLRIDESRRRQAACQRLIGCDWVTGYLPDRRPRARRPPR